VRAGLARVRASGKRLGRPGANVAVADIVRTVHLSVREAADALGVSRSVVHRTRLSQKPLLLISSGIRLFRTTRSPSLNHVFSGRDQQRSG